MISAPMHSSVFAACRPLVTILTVGLSHSILQFRLEDGRLTHFSRKMNLSAGFDLPDSHHTCATDTCRRILPHGLKSVDVWPS